MAPVPVPAITDVTTLTQAAADFLIRSSLAQAQIPLFIQLAEAEFNRRLRHQNMAKRAHVETVAGQAYYGWPPDALEIRHLAFDDAPRRWIEYKTPQQLDIVYSGGSAYDGHSRFYTTYGRELMLLPSPDTEKVLQIFYYAAIPPLGGTDPITSDPITTNWLLRDHPDLYLFGVLLKAQPYLHDDQRLTVWAQVYGDALQSVLDTQDRQIWNAGPMSSNAQGYTP